MNFKQFLTEGENNPELCGQVNSLVWDCWIRYVVEQMRDLKHVEMPHRLAACLMLDYLACGAPPDWRREVEYGLSVMKHAATDPDTQELLAELIAVIGTPPQPPRMLPTPSSN